MVNKCCINLTDEELGGLKGMKLFLELEYFKKLNVGFALDEGMYDMYKFMCIAGLHSSDSTKLLLGSGLKLGTLLHREMILLL